MSDPIVVDGIQFRQNATVVLNEFRTTVRASGVATDDKGVTEAAVRAALEAMSGGSGDHGHFLERYNSGTHGGTFIGGSWIDRNLNTTISSVGTSISRTGNTITLAPGSYEVDGWAIGCWVRGHQCQLWNTTNSTPIEHGSNVYCTFQQATPTSIHIETLVVPSTTSIKLRHRCMSSRNDYGLGLAMNFGSPETYASLLIRKRG